MYLFHYNLAEKPFQITTNPKFLWLGEKHQEALAILKYGVLDNRGFLLLTGDVGTGKTTLINTLLMNLDSDTIVATVVDPNLEQLDFFNFLACAFEIEDKFTKKGDFLNYFARFLNDAYLLKKKVLLIIDEAQGLSIELLEEIRLLSNIEKENTKLLNIFFVGQNEFEKTLTGKGCRALRQRITITHQINPLTESETSEYIKYRLKVAGTEKEIFNRKAISKIYAFSCGYPRLINIICDDALLTGYVRGVKTINSLIVKECARELTMPGETRPNHLQVQPPAGKQGKKTLRRGALYACLLLLIAFLGYLLNPLGYNYRIQNLKNYYGRLSSGLEGLSSKQPAEKIKIRVQEPQQPPMVRPVSQAEKHDAGMPPFTTDAGLQESLADADRRRRAAVVAQKEERADGARRESFNKGEKPLLSGDLKLRIPFNYNTNQLPAKAYDTLDRLASVMVQNREIEIVVKGYTDTLGANHYNKKLSELRASTVKTYLVAKGISPLRIHSTGFGEENPVEPNTTVAGRAANRRVEIKLHPHGGR
ncbi:MAG: OmpA family protein [Desulfobacterales bacterium]|nr:OmpA family protein [Desulfobacterales bacterium]